MIDSAIFIGAIIIAIVQAIKCIFPQVSGAITTIVAILIGVLTAVLAPHVGIVPITIAQGIMTALASVGVHTVVSSAGSKS